MTSAKTETFRIADAARRERHVFMRDLILPAMIGIHTHERGTTQPIRINVDLSVSEGNGPEGDVIESVVDYEQLANRIAAIVQEGHVNLVETLAERIAAACFEDERVRRTRVRVEKLEAIKNAASVGVEIERTHNEA